MWWVGHPTTKKKRTRTKMMTLVQNLPGNCFGSNKKNAEKFEDIGTILCLFWEEENKNHTHTHLTLNSL
jgi:hypothetical protein